MKKPSADFYYGVLTGSIIFHSKLPTLNIDKLRAAEVINVSEEETKEVEELGNIWFEKTLSKDKKEKLQSDELFKQLVIFRHKLARKYLPHKLECYIDKVPIKNKEDFKKGINIYLWETDMSWYSAEDDFFEELGYYSWCNKITLTLQTRTE